jgi:PKD repeat protein
MRTILFSLLLGLTTWVFAQNSAPCLTDEINQEYLNAHPEAKESLIKIRQEMAQYMENPQHRHAKATKYVIPVVFHVIHEYGDENISKEQILDQLRVLNEDFSRTNADRVNTRSIWDDRVADMEIEFQLATIDPDGNCTEGITRTYSSETNIGDNNTKDVVRWPYREYLNIWVVRNIAREPESGGTILGYAQLPYATNGTIDGIVIRADRVGTIGTSNAARAGRTLTHEVGHWLGLLHPFQGGCESNCSNRGDYICDTPPVDEPSYGCPTGNNTCSGDSPNEVDMVENFMDYANGNCQNAFTEGQRDVCHYYLERSTNGRALNASTSNLTATGVGKTPNCSPIADFYVDANEEMTICQGGTVKFKDWSYNGDITSRTWEFEGGSPSTTTFENPEVTYDTPGTYKVKLTVGNSNGSNSMERTAFIQVLPAVSENLAPLVEALDDNVFNDGFTADNDGTTFGWGYYTITSYSGDGCLRANITNNTEDNQTFELKTRSYDISQLGDNPVLSFRAAYGRRSSTATELMIVSASTDCGNTWRSLFGFNAFNGMETAATPTPNWQPSSPSDWRTLSVDLSQVSGATNIVFRFEAVSKQGNSIFIDDLSVGKFKLSTESMDEFYGLNIYPNPTDKGSVTVTFDNHLKEEFEVNLLDATGRLVFTKAGTSKLGHKTEIKIDELCAGIYYLNLQGENRKSVKKIIVN